MHVGTPRNLVTGKFYEGFSAMVLESRQFASPYWLTIQEIADMGGQVGEGEKPMTIPIDDKRLTVAEVTVESTTKMFHVSGHKVFNVLQTSAIAHPRAERSIAPLGADRVDSAERIFEKMPSRPTVNETRSVESFYDSDGDTIYLPAFDRFGRKEGYYLRMFHELVHATGHRTRLDRHGVRIPPKKKALQNEEVLAELGAAFLAESLGIVEDGHEGSAAYIHRWIGHFDAEETRRCLAKAERIATQSVEYILGNA